MAQKTKPVGAPHVGLQSVDWVGTLVIAGCISLAIILNRRDLDPLIVVGWVSGVAAALLAAIVVLKPARSGKTKAS